MTFHSSQKFLKGRESFEFTKPSKEQKGNEKKTMDLKRKLNTTSLQLENPEPLHSAK